VRRLVLFIAPLQGAEGGEEGENVGVEGSEGVAKVCDISVVEGVLEGLFLV
jgi:hypothetical protein